MDVIYALIPSMIIIGLGMVGLLYWAARSGQFDDLEGDAQRILMEDEFVENKSLQKNEAAQDDTEQASAQVVKQEAAKQEDAK